MKKIRFMWQVGRTLIRGEGMAVEDRPLIHGVLVRVTECDRPGVFVPGHTYIIPYIFISGGRALEGENGQE